MDYHYPLVEQYDDFFATQNDILGNDYSVQWIPDILTPPQPVDMYNLQKEIQEKAGIEPNKECHDEVSLEEWQRRVGKMFDSYRII